MKRRLVPILCSVLLGASAAASRGQSDEDNMREQLRSTLPKYSPVPADSKAAGSSIGTPAPLSDDPLVFMPNFEVLFRRAPAGDPDNWLNHEGLRKKAMAQYRNSMTDFEWALNRWYIPLPFGFSLTPAPQSRADADYQAKKMAAEVGRLAEVIKAVAQVDPVAAKKLRRDLDLDRHPAN